MTTINFHSPWRFVTAGLVAIAVLATPPTQRPIAAADTGTAAEAKDDVTDNEKSVDELFEDIKQKMTVNRKQATTQDEIAKLAGEVVEITEQIRKRDDVSDDQMIQAIELESNTLQFLANFDEDAKAKLDALNKELESSSNAAVKSYMRMVKLEAKVGTAFNASPEELESLVGDVMDQIEEIGVNRTTYSIASQLAQMLAYKDQSKLAAELYEDLAVRLEDSEDEQMRSMAARARGSARRLALMDNSMEVSGKTADGEAVNLDDYMGKVVLVDFWASWCGPCIGEIPNMKKALENYPDKFVILGINMDDSIDAYQTALKKHEISWTNIVGDEENGSGWSHPIAVRYGISGIPTAILVDQKGKVVSLNARGNKLDEKLEELLGEPESDSDDASEKSDS